MNPCSTNAVMNPYANAHCVLKVNVTCEACKMKLWKLLSSICGVYKVDIDAVKGLAVIQGEVDPNVLLRELSRSGEHAELLHVKLQHPALEQRNSSSNLAYYNRNAIQDGYGRRMALADQPYYDNGDRRYNNNVNYALPQISNYGNTNDYDYATLPRHAYEDGNWNCSIM